MVPLVREVLTELRARLSALYGEQLATMMLFGSHARSQAEPGSDIDVLVVLRGPVSPGVEISRVGPITAALSLEHGLVISCTFIEQQRHAQEQSPLLLNIRHEGVPI